MDKQGMAYWQLAFVMYLLVALLVIGILGFKAKYVLSDEEYVDAYSKITALTINSMLYSDYELESTLYIPNFFNIEILDETVKASIDGTEKEYNFIPDSNFAIIAEREEDKLVLKKVKA